MRDVPRPRYVQETYRLYGDLWRTGGHKCTERVLVLYYKHELTSYGYERKQMSSRVEVSQMAKLEP